MSIADKLTTIAENEVKVYEAGKNAEYDAFWDTFQQNGSKTIYRNAFANTGWTPEIFKPKYKIVLGANDYSAVGMFYWFGNADAPELDYRTVKHMIDTSGITSAQEMFHSARINYIDVDFSNCQSIYCCFAGGWQARTLTHITLKISEKCTNMAYAFSRCDELTDLFFAEGSVVAADIDLEVCPLTKSSMENAINALSPTVSGKTIILNKSAKDATFTADEWAALIATKSNWTISLV